MRDSEAAHSARLGGCALCATRRPEAAHSARLGGATRRLHSARLGGCALCATRRLCATVNARSQEAMGVLAACLYHAQKLELGSHTPCFQKVTARHTHTHTHTRTHTQRLQPKGYCQTAISSLRGLVVGGIRDPCWSAVSRFRALGPRSRTRRRLRRRRIVNPNRKSKS